MYPAPIMLISVTVTPTAKMPSAKVVANSVNAWGEKKRPSNGAELDLKALNPDADGDGHVTEQEKEIYAALKAADVDGTGTIGLG